MPYKKCTLPEYPVKTDMWLELKKLNKPIVVYGMGNGADKLFLRLEKYGITPADIFASDGFVRGHSFRGMRVKSFSEIKAEYSDFAILLSFASNRCEVIEMLNEIDQNYDLYIPDMPVAGEEYFDSDFYNIHYEEIISAYNQLCDDDSKNAFSSIIRYKLSGRIEYLRSAYSTKDELYSTLPRDKIFHFTDVGAYNGDTLREGLFYFKNLTSAFAIEPDFKNFKRLKKYTDTLENFDVQILNAAAWDSSMDGRFMSSGNRNSSVNSTSSYEHSDIAVPLVAIDDLNLTTDFIKYDVEGAEYEALLGSLKTIKENSPALLVSLYHRSRDIFSLINFLGAELTGYKMYLRRLMCVPAWEIDLILVKNA